MSPGSRYESGVAYFFRSHRGQLFASSALMAPMSKAFVGAIDRFVAEQAVPLVAFEKGQRKDAVMAGRLARSRARRAARFGGKAQAKAAAWRLSGGRTARPVALSLARARRGHGAPARALGGDSGLRPVLPEVLRLLPV